jgi:microcystin-dependent protein
MGATTGSFLLPYPSATDPADVPADVKALADRLEVVLGQLQAATPAQPLPGDLKWVGYPVAAGSENTQCPGWLLCDGRAVSRTGATAALFAKIGTAHGAGDGSTTFNLPDARGRAPMGAGAGPGLTARALGAKLGEESHVLSVGELPAHDHGGATAAGTLAAHATQAGSTGTGTIAATSTGQQPATDTGAESADHSHTGYTNVTGAHSHTSPVRQADGSFLGQFIVAGATGDNSTTYSGDKWGTAGSVIRSVSGTTTQGDHQHSVQTYGRSNSHTHSVPAHSHSIPALNVPALTIPALTVNAQPIPPLAISPQGGGAGANVVQPSFVANCLIKT